MMKKKTAYATAIVLALASNLGSATELKIEAIGPASGYDPGEFFGTGPFPDGALFTHRFRVKLDSCEDPSILGSLLDPSQSRATRCLMAGSVSKYGHQLTVPWSWGDLAVTQRGLSALLQDSTEHMSFQFVLDAQRTASDKPWASVGKETTFTRDDFTWTNASYMYGYKERWTIYEGGFSTFNVTIPEPSSLSMLILGFAGLFSLKRRVRR